MGHMILKSWGSVWGWILHRDPRVYAYIADSLSRYPDRRQLAAQFRGAGFEVLKTRHAFLGLIECLHVKKREAA
jgi:ubiquinone/menaquinone biosynthesis C-methylase UbiE